MTFRLKAVVAQLGELRSVCLVLPRCKEHGHGLGEVPRAPALFLPALCPLSAQGLSSLMRSGENESFLEDITSNRLGTV